MATADVSGFVRQLHRAALLHNDSGLTDGELLEAFLADRQEAAFEALLRRHGPMVLGVCRRALLSAQDAEDCFQATFLVLVRKARSILPRDMVGNWLYGVAWRTAQEAKKMNAKRRAKERQLHDVAGKEDRPDDVCKALLAVLDRELLRLPDKYRVPIILCDLEGKTHKEAARQLGWPQGTLSCRLVRARALLTQRLTRHGLTLSGGALGVLAAQQPATAAVPVRLFHATAKAALAARGGISAKVAALAANVEKVLWLCRVKHGMALVALTMILVAAAIGVADFPAVTAAEVPAGDEASAEPWDRPAGATGKVAEHAVPPQKGTRPQNEQAGATRRTPPGSGTPFLKMVPLADFNAVDIASAFDAEIGRGDVFQVAITGEDERIQVVKEGTTLRIRGASGPKEKRTRLTITMPSLRAVLLDGPVRATVRGFESKEAFQAILGKDSTLQGTIMAGRVEMDISGSSKVALQGSADQGTFSGSGTGQLLLSDFPLDSAVVNLTGKSTAKLHVRSKLDYVVKGVSHLWYRGHPTLGKSERRGAAVATRE